MESLVIDCGCGVVSAAFGSVEEARRAVPELVGEAAKRARKHAARAESAGQGVFDFEAPARDETNFEVQESARRGGYKKVAIPRDKDVCRALFALMVTLLLPSDKVERSVENVIHRFALRGGYKKVDAAVKYLVSVGLIETEGKRKRTYYWLAPGALDALTAAAKEVRNV